MTLIAKTGTENAVKALQYFLAQKLPAAITELNAATSAMIQARLAGPYVFAEDTTLNFFHNRGDEIIVDVPAATYSVTQLSVLLNNDAPFFSKMVASESMGALLIKVDTCGVAGSIELGDSAAWPILGLRQKGVQPGQTSNYYPLRNLASIEVGFENIEPVAYPALIISASEVSRPDYSIIAVYSVDVILYETVAEPSLNDVLYTNLIRTAKIIYDVIDSDKSLKGQANAVAITSYNTNKMIEIPRTGMVAIRGSIEFNLEIRVQEE